MSYRLAYNVEVKAGNYKKGDEPEGWGLTDGIVVLSCLEDESGCYSMKPFSMDGQTNKPMSDERVFKAWLTLAASLSQSEELGPGRRTFAASVIEAVREGIEEMKREESRGL